MNRPNGDQPPSYEQPQDSTFRWCFSFMAYLLQRFAATAADNSCAPSRRSKRAERLTPFVDIVSIAFKPNTKNRFALFVAAMSVHYLFAATRQHHAFYDSTAKLASPGPRSISSTLCKHSPKDPFTGWAEMTRHEDPPVGTICGWVVAVLFGMCAAVKEGLARNASVCPCSAMITSNRNCLPCSGPIEPRFCKNRLDKSCGLGYCRVDESRQAIQRQS
jgi:hypothetical protein